MRSIIIAEDEELFRRELAAATPWEEFGFFLAGEAADGEEAFAIVQTRHPDAIIADIRMPRLDGLGLLERLSTAFVPSERPLTIILTGHSEFEYARRALKLGAFDYLLKPLDDAELAHALRRLAEAVDAQRRHRALDAVANNAEGDAPAIAFFSEYTTSDTREPADLYVAQAVAEICARFVVSLSVEEVAAHLGISGGHLARIFKARTGFTFAEYLTRYRMQRAVELLRNPAIRIGEVADLVGYRDQRHFSAVFRKLVGVTPTQFRGGKYGSVTKLVNRNQDETPET